VSHAMVIVCTEHRAFFALPLRARPLPRGDIRSGQLEHDQVEGGPPACAKGGGRGEKSSRTSRSLMPAVRFQDLQPCLMVVELSVGA
jgi:hypothetical protein